MFYTTNSAEGESGMPDTGFVMTDSMKWDIEQAVQIMELQSRYKEMTGYPSDELDIRLSELAEKIGGAVIQDRYVQYRIERGTQP